MDVGVEVIAFEEYDWVEVAGKVWGQHIKSIKRIRDTVPRIQE